MGEPKDPHYDIQPDYDRLRDELARAEEVVKTKKPKEEPTPGSETLH